jgi:hypothetical protein
MTAINKAFKKARGLPKKTSIYTRRSKLLEMESIPNSHLFELIYFHFFIGTINIKTVKWFIKAMPKATLKDLLLLDAKEFEKEPIKTQFYILKLKDHFTFQVLTKHAPEIKRLLTKGIM